MRASWRSSAAQHRERVDALDAGVVRDLVVGEEGRVADRAPGVEVADDRRDLKVALDDRAPGADQRVGERALDPRADVAAALLGGVVQLLDDVADHQGDGAGDAVRVREVGVVVLAETAGPAAVEHRAHRQQRVRGVAGEDVRAAGAVGVQQAAAVRVAALDLGGVLRMVGDDRPAALLLPPAERRHVLVRAVQQPRLAGAGLRGPVGLPGKQPVRSAANPAVERGQVAVA